MLIKLTPPQSTQVTVKNIQPGVVFWGTAYPNKEPKLHLRIANNNIVNLATFELWQGQWEDSIVYHYKEITDAILTTRNRVNLDDTIRHSSCNCSDCQSMEATLES